MRFNSNNEIMSHIGSSRNVNFPNDRSSKTNCPYYAVNRMGNSKTLASSRFKDAVPFSDSNRDESDGLYQNDDLFERAQDAQDIEDQEHTDKTSPN